jgi:SlyX protein
MEEKITDLEIRMTHQEVTLEELTRTVLQQERLLLELQNELKQVREQLRGFSIIASAAEETPPPHY